MFFFLINYLYIQEQFLIRERELKNEIASLERLEMQNRGHAYTVILVVVLALVVIVVVLVVVVVVVIVVVVLVK